MQTLLHKLLIVTYWRRVLSVHILSRIFIYFLCGGSLRLFIYLNLIHATAHILIVEGERSFLFFTPVEEREKSKKIFDAMNTEPASSILFGLFFSPLGWKQEAQFTFKSKTQLFCSNKMSMQHTNCTQNSTPAEICLQLLFPCSSSLSRKWFGVFRQLRLCKILKSSSICTHLNTPSLQENAAERCFLLMRLLAGCWHRKNSNDHIKMRLMHVKPSFGVYLQEHLLWTKKFVKNLGRVGILGRYSCWNGCLRYRTVVAFLFGFHLKDLAEVVRHSFSIPLSVYKQE